MFNLFLVSGVGLLSASIVITAAANQNTVFRLFTLQFIESRTQTAIVAFSCSLGIITGVSLLTTWQKRPLWLTVMVIYLFASSIGIALSTKDTLSKFLSDPNASTSSGLIAKNVVDGWRNQSAIDISVAPTSLCLGADNECFVAGYAGNYYQSGSVVRVNLLSESVSGVATGLTRPHGVEFFGGCLFVSRAGQHTKATDGIITQLSTGAVTKLQDLDKDGVFEFYHDVISDLPGPQLPDGLHQNNAIACNSSGDLFVTVGNCGNRTPSRQDLEGCIIRLDTRTDETSIYANGFRNPFGLCVAESGTVYCTDNDPNESNPGDKILQVSEGKHHGHPYDAMKNVEINGVESEITRLTSAQGIDAIPEKLQSIFGGDLLVANYGDNSISVINSETRKATFFATVPTAVDVCVDKDGNVFACSYQDRKLYTFMRVKNQ